MENFKVDLLFEGELNQAVVVEEIKDSKKVICEYFMNILEGFEKDIIAFDIVFPSPETGQYNFISFFKGSEDFVKEVQDFAKEDFYRTSILSLSSILIEKYLERNCKLKLKDSYKNVVVIEREREGYISSVRARNVFLFPFEFRRKSFKDASEIKDEIEKKISEGGEDKRFLRSTAHTIISTIIENLESSKCKNLDSIITKFMRYLVWINMVGNWKMYVYISVDISEEYNFGLVLLLKNHYSDIQEKVKEIINKLRKKFVKDFAEYFLRKLRRKAIINAMATIMSRNMSHNIGSHILFYISSGYLYSEVEREEIIKFIIYLQQRMDFIAYISTGEWLPVGSIHFIVEDIILNFLSQKLLLNYIGFSEGVSLNNLIIKVYLNKEDLVSFEAGKIEKRLNKDIKVFIPLGIVGFQALYSIFENIIRNSAKYGFATKKEIEKLKITVDIKEEDSNIYLKIYDNVSKVDKSKVEEIETEILKPLLSETGEIELKNWGLKEIRICASFLTNKNIESLKERIDRSVSPVKVEITDDGYLTYTIQLLKGEEVYDGRGYDA